MPAESTQDRSAESPQQDEEDTRSSDPELRRAFRRLVIRPFVEAMILYALFWMSAHFAIARTHGGEIIDLTPKGLGFVIDVLVIVVGMTLFQLFYSFPALFARKSLGLILKALMYLLFVVFLAWLQWEKFVAVQLVDGQIMAIRHWPQAPVVVSTLPRETRSTGAVTSLAFLDGSPEGIRSVSVYRCDAQTTDEMHKLAVRLGALER